jgi:uncharacterized protein
MKYLFHLGHPAHFHLFKNVILKLTTEGHSCAVLIKKKDILEELLQKSNIEYFNLLPHGRSDSKLGIAVGLLKTDFRLLRFALRFKPDLMIGTSYAISHVGKVLNIPSLNVNEDDFDVVPLYSKLSYPWASGILAPDVCKTGKWVHKTINYPGYHELAYLHPNHFTPEKSIVSRYFNPDKPYFILRFAKLSAHHDSGINGINYRVAKRIIELVEPHGNVYITSERVLEEEFEKYRMAINPLDIHHVMAFADVYIGDSQTMAAEAGVLGTPFIRFNDFVGRIGYLNDLEEIYKLGFGINTREEQILYSTVSTLISMPGRKEEWQERRRKLLLDKIDVSEFMHWLIREYPESLSEIRKNPEYVNRFK